MSASGARPLVGKLSPNRIKLELQKFFISPPSCPFTLKVTWFHHSQHQWCLMPLLKQLRTEYHPLSSFSLTPETKDRADIQTPSSEDTRLTYCLFYNHFLHLKKEIKQFPERHSNQQSRVVCNGPLATDILGGEWRGGKYQT